MTVTVVDVCWFALVGASFGYLGVQALRTAAARLVRSERRLALQMRVDGEDLAAVDGDRW